MRFNPKSEEELQAMTLIDPGVYNFEVVAAKDRTSKSGNEMIELQLKLWDMQGHEKIVYDYLLEAMSFKLRHFAECTGLLDKYQAGELQALDCSGRQGKVEIVVQQGQKKPEGGYYPDKNSVKDYVKPNGEEPKSATPANAEEDLFGDSIPF